MKKAAQSAAEDVAASRGSLFRRSKVDEDWTPPTRDLAWYHEWSVNHRRQADIAFEAGVARQTVHKAIKRVDAWLRGQLIDDVLAQRARQTEALEQLAAECRIAWVKTGDIGYADEFRKVLTDIRRMLGIDKPQQVEVTVDNGLDRVAGVDRDAAIRAQAEALLATIGDSDADDAIDEDDQNADAQSG